jgi:hypothetical protein
MDLQARREAAKADARAKRAMESADDLRLRWEAPLIRLAQTLLALIDALKRKGVLDAVELQEEVAQLRQAQTALQESRSPFDFS